MNKKIQLLVVALVSFGLGATTTYLLSLKEPQKQSASQFVKSDTQTAEVAKEESRKPFFVKPEVHNESEQVRNEAVATEEAVKASGEKKPVDYFNLAKNIRDFQDKVSAEIRKTFKTISLSDETQSAKKDRLNGKYEMFFEENRLWYKAEVDVSTGEKLHLFFNYYNCDVDRGGKKKNEPRDILERCFVMWGFLYYKQNWEQYSISSNSDFFLWKDDMPYAALEIENLGDYAKENSLLKMMVPIPDDSDPMYSLNYRDGKFQWTKGQTVNWRPVNDKGIKKFMDMVNKHQTGWPKP
ncbi:hypothetical protein DOM21_18880 [Bacteriovorax stolpii]|uniref:Uncharacterized protein n=1 Tax=Bacteriovorax stolpii TaxID=960 RepID=A0A2K9NM49_BACTC|nr:hypothetical protein [Bacteriovorax stolpii]AUN96586.1 hypothetical protein C0V70_00390 [Bacteriovorax stolpii]QDK43482.1 hypothetical protein DOM21_18880 [Bacteriovorax stolpii]